MSRSVKKTPVCTGSGRERRGYAKRQANKRVRKEPFLSDGGHYKKVAQQRNIIEYRFYRSKEKSDWWEKCYRRK